MSWLHLFWLLIRACAAFAFASDGAAQGNPIEVALRKPAAGGLHDRLDLCPEHFIRTPGPLTLDVWLCVEPLRTSTTTFEAPVFTRNSSHCALNGQLALRHQDGALIQSWTDVVACSHSSDALLKLAVHLPQQLCQKCTFEYRPVSVTSSVLQGCLNVQAAGQRQAQKRLWHFLNPLPVLRVVNFGPLRRLLQTEQTADVALCDGSVVMAGRVSIESGKVTVCAVPVLAACPSSDTCPIQGYEGCLEVTGPAQGEPPAQKHWVHWTLDNAAQAGAGASFAVELKATEDDNGVPQVPGWVGLGWSPQGPAHHPPQMINATTVLGWINQDNIAQIHIFNLWSKSIVDIRPSHDQFTVTNESIAITPELHLVLRFHRAFDTVFRPDRLQRMITAHAHFRRGLARHDHRAALLLDPAGRGSMRVVGIRLDNRKVQAHAWLMFAAFGIVLPAGVLWARYFRDLFGKWYLMHVGIQVMGLLLALAGFLVAITQFHPIPRSLAHFQLGLAVITLALLQPLNSLPRLTMHHAHVMRSIYWAWLHWLLGRATILFAWVNIFLGVGRYRTWFTLGSWPEGAFGIYIGVLILVCTIMESHLQEKVMLRKQDDNDELNKRLSDIEAWSSGTGAAKAEGSAQLLQNRDDDLLFNQQDITRSQDIDMEDMMASHDEQIEPDIIMQSNLDCQGLREFDSSASMLTDTGSPYRTFYTSKTE